MNPEINIARTNCQRCGQTIEYNGDTAEQSFACPSCGDTILTATNNTTDIPPVIVDTERKQKIRWRNIALFVTSTVVILCAVWLAFLWFQELADARTPEWRLGYQYVTLHKQMIQAAPVELGAYPDDKRLGEWAAGYLEASHYAITDAAKRRFKAGFKAGW